MTTPRLPSLRALQAFNAAARLHSFSRAADELAITHGAVSRLIGLLEDWLGTPLFHRLARGVEPTTAGRRLFEKTGQAFLLLEQGLAEAVPQTASGAILVSLASSVALTWLMPRLAQFALDYPAIGVTIDANDALIDIAHSKHTVALRYGDGDWDGVYASLLAREELLVVAAPAMLEGLSLPMNPAQILAQPLLHDDFHGGWGAWAALAGQALATPLPGPHFNNTAMLIEAAQQGKAVALVRRMLVGDALKAGRLQQISPITLPVEHALYMVCRRGEERRAPIAAFMRWLRGAVAAS